jgi:hypothetical protein
MNIELIDASLWQSINPQVWNSLAEDSVLPNPFYERWCLGPAIKNLGTGLELYVACGYKDGNLQALCPVVVNKSYSFIRQVEVWRHLHCSLSSPLIRNIEMLPEFLTCLLNAFNCPVLRISNHPKAKMVSDNQKYFIIDQYQRAAQNLNITWKDYLDQNLGKKQRKYKNILHRIETKLRTEYQNISTGDLTLWLHRFSAVESTGWKYRVGTSLSQNTEELKYYSDCIEMGQRENKIEFQSIATETQDIAISFRFITHNQCFEIKTSYHDDFRRYSPGIALELYNLKDMFAGPYDYADSCAEGDNVIVHRLWQQRRELLSGLLFQPSLQGRIIYNVFEIAKKLRS